MKEKHFFIEDEIMSRKFLKTDEERLNESWRLGYIRALDEIERFLINFPAEKWIWGFRDKIFEKIKEMKNGRKTG